MNLSAFLREFFARDTRNWNVVVSLLMDINHQIEEIMTALSDLQAEVAATATIEQSAVTLIQGIAAQLAAALAASGSNDPALVDLSTQLTASAVALSAAVTANTPTPPADAPTP